MKLFKLIATVLFAIAGLGFTACSSDSDDREDDTAGSSIVGTWRCKFSTGYHLLTLSANGTGSWTENDTSDGYSDTDIFRYIYDEKSKELLFVYTEEGDTDFFTVVTHSDNMLILVDSDGDSYTFTRTSSGSGGDDAQPETTSVVGTWTYSYGNGDYDRVVFRSDGSGYWEEYSNADRQSYTDPFTYTYNPTRKELKILFSGESYTDVYTVVSLSKSKLVLEDEDGERYTFASGSGSGSDGSDEGDGPSVTTSLYGTWGTDLEGGYERITFRSNGTGTMTFIPDDGETDVESIRFTYDEQSQVLMITTTADGETISFRVKKLTATRLTLVADAGTDFEISITFYRE